MNTLSKIAQKIEAERIGYLEAKSELDNAVNLNQTRDDNVVMLTVDRPAEDGYMTLLSEGSILHSDGTIRLYIAKGTLSKFMDSIDENYEGYISTGHRSLNSYPVREGYFRKEDLKLVTDKNGRSDLLVKPHVNTKLSNVRDIIIQNEPFAISSEFKFANMEIKDEELVEYAKLTAYNISKGGSEEFPITDSIYITGFSLVGNPGNAKSGGYDPSMLLNSKNEGETKLSKQSIIDSMFSSLTRNREKDEQLANEDVNPQETPAEEVDPQPTESPESEEVKEEAAETATETEILEKATKLIEQLSAKNEALEAEIAELKAQLSVKDKEGEQLAKAKQQSVDKLLGMFEKFDAKFEEPKTVGLSQNEGKPTNIFGRESIWED